MDDYRDPYTNVPYDSIRNVLHPIYCPYWLSRYIHSHPDSWVGRNVSDILPLWGWVELDPVEKITMRLPVNKRWEVFLFIWGHFCVRTRLREVCFG